MPLPRSDRELVLLHNPRCSKSRAAHALLNERGVCFVIRNYLEDPLSPKELADLRRRLGKSPSPWVRRGEAAYRAAGLSADSEEAELLEAVARYPILLERPILVRGARAVVGRPPERILALLDEPA